MRIYLHIGPDQMVANRIQQVLADKREQLQSKGVMFPRSPGDKNHTRLYMAVTDPDHVDPLRFNRGFADADRQAGLLSSQVAELARDVERQNPDTLILSSPQFGFSLYRVSELERLRSVLTPLSDDIRIVAHVENQARMLARYFAAQVMEGRSRPLDQELAAAASGDWWQACMESMPAIEAAAGQFAETQGAPFWLDYRRWAEFWESVFGAGSVAFRPIDLDLLAGENATEEIRAAFGIEPTIGKATPEPWPAEPSAASVTRSRQLNDLLLHVLGRGRHVLPRQLWRSFLSEISVEGEPIAAGSLSAIGKAFDADNKALVKAQPALAPAFAKDRARKAWAEADPERGYRASQYLLAFMYRIDKATSDARKDQKSAAPPEAPARPKSGKGDASAASGVSPEARALMPPLAMQNYERLRGSPYAPHNRLGAVNEEELAAPYPPMTPRKLPKGSSGNVIVGCMKNEAPYIIEWVAYHRAIGVDNFLIYTNGCEDGTAEILDRLQELGVLQHRNNDDWKGNSPQQYALNRSLKEPVIRNADWIIHIDVDEFINIRCGNGTLDDFFERVPDATNVAMTWRLFGHSGVTELEDRFVIDQFDACAPKFCPKPHTVWGFKTMVRNIGAYAKLSCHRPNKLDEEFRTKVKWVNGSGKDMTGEAAEKGWRNSKKSIGYDLLQLNHYALRSAESFLIKRQRGRALHVDRSIGLNYWIRMDWSGSRDITIKRNVPRLRAEFDRLMQDDILRGWHEKGLDWHRAKAEELHGQQEFEDLYQQALQVKLTETERVAYALALDMES